MWRLADPQMDLNPAAPITVAMASPPGTWPDEFMRSIKKPHRNPRMESDLAHENEKVEKRYSRKMKTPPIHLCPANLRRMEGYKVTEAHETNYRHTKTQLNPRCK